VQIASNLIAAVCIVYVPHLHGEEIRFFRGAEMLQAFFQVSSKPHTVISSSLASLSVLGSQFRRPTMV